MPARVVVVHDDPSFVDETVEALRRAGWEATGFVDTMKALDDLTNAATVDLLITNLQARPGKPGGLSLALMTLRKRPNLKILFTEDSEFPKLTDGIGIFLPVPLTTPVLLTEVEQALKVNRDAQPIA